MTWHAMARKTKKIPVQALATQIISLRQIQATLSSVLRTMAGSGFCPGLQYHTKSPAGDGADGGTHVRGGMIILQITERAFDLMGSAPPVDEGVLEATKELSAS